MVGSHAQAWKAEEAHSRVVADALLCFRVFNGLALPPPTFRKVLHACQDSRCVWCRRAGASHSSEWHFTLIMTVRGCDWHPACVDGKEQVLLSPAGLPG